jgi:hypothetical protein
MADVLELVTSVAPHLKVGWTLWAGAGLTLVAWWRMLQMTPRPVERPVAKLPTRKNDLSIL